jgi:hypothetical protein
MRTSTELSDASGDAQVEQPVGVCRRLAHGGLAFHHRDRFAQARDLRALHRARGVRRELALDHLACADRLERRLGGDTPRAMRVVHVDAGAHAHLDQPFDLERDQRLAYRRARHASCTARSRSGGRRLPTGNSPRSISARNWSGDLPVEATRAMAAAAFGRKWVKWPDQLSERYAVLHTRQPVERRRRQTRVLGAGPRERYRIP